ncbi:hypothetical protein [Glycomyces harbinensis]|uniref:Uncharacterized protein n=1 Tax=Glycomyces harbinensis TaxID=58114 RepID=A0A1G6V9Q1_9ACTN|nr:hypothetical protein [Glycomyces harbinensis]SDD49546.1 hypothetical protein SAMN05216270_104254 [Glycomyces harbinensis]
MLQKLPINLTGYSLMVTEAPELKTFVKDGQSQVAMTYDTQESIYVVSVFAKSLQKFENGKRPKGEEIKVEFTRDPGEEFDEGMYVQLDRPSVSVSEFTNDKGRTFVTQKFAAEGLVPVSQG